MYTKAKYVVGEIPGGMLGITAALVFSEVVTHSDVAALFVPGSITGAGFCHFDDEDVYVYGDSVSLRIGSSEADRKWVGRSIAHPKYMT